MKVPNRVKFSATSTRSDERSQAPAAGSLSGREEVGNPDWTDVKGYLKIGSTLYNSGGADMLNNTFGTFSVDGIPKVPTTSFDKLSDVAPAEFWSPFK